MREEIDRLGSNQFLHDGKFLPDPSKINALKGDLKKYVFCRASLTSMSSPQGLTESA